MITSKQKRCSKACVSVAALLQAVTLHSNNNLLATAFVFQPIIIHPLIQPSPSRRQTLQPYNYKCVVPLAANNKWSQDIEENSRRRAAGGAGETGFPGETFAGAVLGGLLGGPFGEWYHGVVFVPYTVIKLLAYRMCVQAGVTFARRQSYVDLMRMINL